MRYAFVSCDIIGHSRESSIEIQRGRIAAINEIVRQAISVHEPSKAIWASGGDGGHIAFVAHDFAESAVNLIVALRQWSIRENVPLRIVGNCGEVEQIKGADGRVQMVGHGINLAGRLLQLSDETRVVVTEEFREAVQSARLDRIRFHDERTVQVIYFLPQLVCLLSKDGWFDSRWDELPLHTDRGALRKALEQQSGLEVIHRAKRLLQVNVNDQDAKDALRHLTSAGSGFLPRDNLMSELLLDKEYSEEYVHGMQLIERKKGDVLCQAGDEGQTMFMILQGQLAGYFHVESKSNDSAVRKPNFVIESGEFAGELAFALQRSRTATPQCSEDTALLSFSYSEFVKSLSDSDRRNELEEFLRRKIRLRIVEHVCNSARFLVGKRPDGPAIGPLAHLKNPWIDLMPFFHIIEQGWRTEAFGPTDATFSKPGVYILLSGKIEAADNAGVILDGESEPILYVKLPGEVEFKHRDFRLLADVKIGAIGAVGLAKFGVATYRNILGVLRDCLAPDSASSQRRQTVAKKHVFLSYSRDNQKDVSQLRDDLMAAGEQVWWDLDILGGQDWKQQIRKAMKEAYAVLVCFSKETDARLKSGIFPELLDAIKAYREYAPGSVFLIPVRLSNCSIPDVEISDTKTLDSLQFIDLFPPTKRKSGLVQLIRSLQSAPEHP